MINRFFFTSSFSPTWLPVFRIGTGLLLLLAGITLWPDLELLYGPGNLVDHRLVAPDPLLPYFSHIGYAYLSVYLLLCAALIAGFYSRWAAVSLCILHHSLFIAQPAFSYGFDFLAATAIFYCIWFPVDRPRSAWATPCLRVLQLHLCMIYFFGGLEKLIGPSWRNGEALWKAMHLPDMMGALRPDVSFLALFPLAVTAVGWAVIILELGYAVLVWFSATRSLWVWSIIGMHAGIALMLGLYHFSALMILFNLVAFYFPYRKTDDTNKQVVDQHLHPAQQQPPWTDPPTKSLPGATIP